MKNKKYLLISTLLLLCACGGTSSVDDLPSTNSGETTSDVNSNTSSEAQTSNIVLPDETIFPEPKSFVTPVAYRASMNNKWRYQAKVEENNVYVYMRHQYDDDTYSHVHFEVRNNTLNSKKISISLFPNGSEVLKNNENITTSLLTKKSSTLIEYFYVIKSSTPITGETKIKFYYYDELEETPYDATDVIETVNSIKYHTHIGNGWSVNDTIGFKNEELYRTPEAYQSRVIDRYGYDMTAQDEGLYIYAYQYVDELRNDVTDNDRKWREQTHIELEIWQHNIGFGWDGTYLALFSDGSTYVNNFNNILGENLEVNIIPGEKTKIEYRYYLSFKNNYDNPNDGPYAFIKLRYFDPSDNKVQYNEKDVVDYRDERFVHTNPGNSVFVHQTVDAIDDPFNGEYAQNRLNLYNNMKMPGNGTLFIGDSYFEKDNWWKNFYNDYSGKNCFTSAIGGTRILQWLDYYDTLIKPYNPKNIVIHLGYNDINGTAASSIDLSNHLKTLLELIHSKEPNAKLFFFNVESSPWFKVSNKVARVEQFNSFAKTIIDAMDYCTYIDGNAISKDAEYEYNNGTWVRDDFFKDGTHPKDENYIYYMQALEDAGCVIENL